MIRLVLLGFDLLSPLLRLARIDYPRFRAILEVKLTLDNRRQGLGAARAGAKPSKATFALALFIYALMGLFVGATLLLCGSALVGLTIELSLVMTMVGMMLIADYSSVLLDTTDNQILQPRPVSGRTIFAARVAHVIVYLSALTFSVAAGGFLFGSIQFGAAFVPLFAVALLLAMLLVVALVNVVYLLAMRLVDGEKLRDIILYFQIAMTVVLTAGYQIMPRLIDMTTLKTLDISGAAWIYAFPPAWFAGAVDFGLGQRGQAQAWLALLALLAPVAALLVAGALAPVFRRALGRLDAHVSPDSSDRPRGSAAAKAGWGEPLARMFCRRPVERAAFPFLWSLIGRDRQFKLRVYPLAVFGLVIGAALLVRPGKLAHFSWEEVRQSKSYLFLLYVNCMMLPTAILHLRYSDQYDAAWIYGLLPLAVPGDILVAAVKLLLVRFITPAYLLSAAVVLAVWGAGVLLDVAVAYCAILLLMSLTALWVGRRLPFSEKYGVVESSGRFVFSLVLMLVPGLLGGMHFLLSQVMPLALPVLGAGLVTGTWGVLALYRSTNWRSIQPAAS